VAEFQNVMKQFDRMCKANAGCVNCPLDDRDGEIYRCSIGAFVNNSERIEREIMSWAAENPEPVYPTWGEWLQRMYNSMNYAGIFITPIPADIAQKLGIEPKEG